MDIIRLFERTKDKCELDIFQVKKIATEMQPSTDSSSDLPALYYMPYKNTGTPRQYDGNHQQRRDYNVRFLIICLLKDLNKCQVALAKAFEGYLHTDEDSLDDLSRPYNEMEYVDGGLVHIQSEVIVWDEIYGNYKIGVS